MDKKNGIEKIGFYIIIFLITAGAVLASWNLARVNPTEINYTINIDKDIISQTTTNTAINMDQLKEEVKTAIKESSTQYILESSDHAMNRISGMIAVTSIFFTVVVVIVALFQYMKNKEYEKEYEKYKNEVAELKEYRKTYEAQLQEQSDSYKEEHSKLKQDLEKSIKYMTMVLQMTEGNRYLNEKEYDEAIRRYQKILDSSAEDYKFEKIEENISMMKSKTYQNLGIAYKAKGELAESIASYKKAIELDPKYARAHNNLGVAYKAKDELEEAIASYKKAIELDPKYALAYYNLGIAYKAKDELEEAIASYKKAIEIDPKYAVAYNNLGAAYQDKGETEEAITSYKKAIEINPKNAAAHYNLGLAYEALKRYKKAIDSYKISKELATDDKDKIDCDAQIASCEEELKNKQ